MPTDAFTGMITDKEKDGDAGPPTAWPHTAVIYLESENPAMLGTGPEGEGDSGDFIAGIIVQPSREKSFITPVGMNGLRVFNIEHTQDLLTGKVGFHNAPRNQPSGLDTELELEKATRFYHRLAGYLQKEMRK